VKVKERRRRFASWWIKKEDLHLFLHPSDLSIYTSWSTAAYDIFPFSRPWFFCIYFPFFLFFLQNILGCSRWSSEKEKQSPTRQWFFHAFFKVNKFTLNWDWNAGKLHADDESKRKTANFWILPAFSKPIRIFLTLPFLPSPVYLALQTARKILLEE